jgi:predicted CopG family antitoxin
MSKTISLTNEAYDLLKSMKLKGESFSDTIKRLAKKGKLSEVLFLYPELQEAEEFEKAVRENRTVIDMRL